MLCDWQPNQVERHVVSHRLDYTVVGESHKWMGTSKHQYLHWLRCQLPQGRHNLTDLKLSHPDVIPVRDRMAAPLRLASWVRFETVMDRREWSTAIAMLVPAIHLPDDALLKLLSQCVPEQGITSMKETQSPPPQLSSRRRPAKRLCRMAHRSHERPVAAHPLPGSFCHPCPFPAAAPLCRGSTFGKSTLDQPSHPS